MDSSARPASSVYRPARPPRAAPSARNSEARASNIRSTAGDAGHPIRSRQAAAARSEPKATK
eukprot:14871312-Alexandrium_andersonii.AAC.1